MSEYPETEDGDATMPEVTNVSVTSPPPGTSDTVTDLPFINYTEAPAPTSWPSHIITTAPPPRATTVPTTFRSGP